MLVGAEGFLFFVLFLFWIWALFDCISTDAAQCRNLPKIVWLILVIFLPDIGALAWLLLGRPERAASRPGRTDYSSRPAARPVAVEDQPRYTTSPAVTDRRSAELDRQLEEWEREQAELRVREVQKRDEELGER